MDKLLRESAILELIDIVNLLYPEAKEATNMNLVKWIKDLPSAEPEIIHCKDCEHYYFADNRLPSEQSWVCGYWGVDNNKFMGFCDRAERRKDGQTT